MNRYHTLSNRIAAYFIDAVVFFPLFIFYFLIDGIELPTWGYYVLLASAPIFGIGYNVVLHWKFGQTIGKMVAQVKVLSLDEVPITFKQAFLRDIGYVVTESVEFAILAYRLAVGVGWDSEPFGSTAAFAGLPSLGWLILDALVLIKSKKNRALHDFIAGTVVIRLNMLSDVSVKNLDPPPPDAYENLLTNTE